MSATRLTTPRAVARILRLKGAILASRLTSASGLAKADGKGRGATARKGSSTFAVIRFSIFVLVFSFGWSYTTISIVGRELTSDPTEAMGSSARGGDSAAFLLRGGEGGPDAFSSQPFRNAMAFVALLWFVTTLAASIGYQGKDIARLDEDVEWLLSLPVSIPAVYAARVVERTLLGFGWGLLAPFFFWVAWAWGWRWTALPLALVMTLAVNFVVAVIQFALEVIVRRLLSPHTLNTLQAICVLVTSLGFVGIGYFPMLAHSAARREAIDEIGYIAGYLPTSPAFEALQTHGAGLAVVALQAALVLGVGMGGWSLVGWASRRGLEAVQSGSRTKQRSGHRRRRLFSGVVAKDLMMFWRDKTLLATVGSMFVSLVPLAFMPGMMLTNGSDPVRWGGISFAVGMWVVVAGATGVLAHEGEALWLLYGVPRSLEGIVLRKAGLWTGLGYVVSLSTYTAGIVYRGGLRPLDAIPIVWIAVGLPIHAVICASVGALATDPFQAERQRRLRPELVVVALLLGGILAAGVGLEGLWRRAYCLAAFVVIATAWWHKARGHLDFLLDPTAAPAPRIYTADGLTAALVFVLLQLLFGILLVSTGTTSPAAGSLIAYAAAAAFAAGVVWDLLRRTGLRPGEAIPLLNRSEAEARRTAFVTLKAGVAAAAIGGAYALLVAVVAPASPDAEGSSLPTAVWELGLVWILGPLVTLVLQPLCEEVLFRGLVFRGFELASGFRTAAIASAAVGVLVVPPVLAAPTFALGLLASWAYARSGALVAPIVVHAIFNAAALAARYIAHGA